MLWRLLFRFGDYPFEQSLLVVLIVVFAVVLLILLVLVVLLVLAVLAVVLLVLVIVLIAHFIRSPLNFSPYILILRSQIIHNA